MQNSQQPRGEPQGLEGKGKGRAKDDDEVSLDYSGDELMEGYHDNDEMEEIDPLDQPGDNNLETMLTEKSLTAPDLVSGKCKPPLKEQ